MLKLERVGKLFVLLSSIIGTSSFSEKEPISLSTYEIPPYVGEELVNLGAVSEIVAASFEASGISIETEFYPAARAFSLATQGRKSGSYPLTKTSKYSSSLILSDPFPGIKLGLLRKKSYEGHRASTSGKVVGVIRGTFESKIHNDLSDAIIQVAGSNEALLKMLFAGRIDYLLVDMYTAADLMVDKYPYMIGRLEFISESLIDIDFHVGFDRSSADSSHNVKNFNKGLKKIRENGTLNRILYTHGLLSFVNGHKKTLRIATVENAEMITMKRLSSEFERENPSIQLDWRVLDESILRRRLLSDLAVSAGQYDIMTIGAYETPIWAGIGWIEPIDNFPESYDLNDIVKVVKASLSHNEKLYALPFYAESSMTYYRKDLFERAGIVMADQPTWEQVESYAKAINDPFHDIYGICLRGKSGWGENIALLSTIVNTFGGQWFDMEWNSKISTPEWEKAISFYINILNRYGPPKVEANGYTESLNLFLAGKCGIWIDATVAAGTLFDPRISAVSDVLGFSAAPIGGTAKGESWLWTWALAISSSSKNKKEALQFIQWATSKNYVKLAVSDSGWAKAPPGTRYSTYKNKKYQSAAPFSNFVLNAIESSTPKDKTLNPSPYKGIQFVAIPEFPAIGAYVGLKVNQALQGRITVKKAIRESSDFADKKMREAGYK